MQIEVMIDRLKTLCFGEILFDRIKGEHFLGGAPANVAVHLSRLGAHSRIVSAVGDDSLGKRSISLLNEEGVGTEHIMIHPSLTTGVVEADTAESAAWDHLCLSDSSDIYSQKWDLLYSTTLAQRTANNRKIFESLLKRLDYEHLFFDISQRPKYYSPETLGHTLPYANILKLNTDDLPHVSRYAVWGSRRRERILRTYAVPLSPGAYDSHRGRGGDGILFPIHAR